MDKLAVEYSGMNLGVLALWIVILALTGFAARKILNAKPLLGFLGDAIFGLLGVFVVATLLKAFDVSLSAWIDGLNLGPLNNVTRWVDIAVLAFVGALALRAVLKPVTK